jgi:hypothetical protein
MNHSPSEDVGRPVSVATLPLPTGGRGQESQILTMFEGSVKTCIHFGFRIAELLPILQVVTTKRKLLRSRTTEDVPTDTILIRMYVLEKVIVDHFYEAKILNVYFKTL